MDTAMGWPSFEVAWGIVKESDHSQPRGHGSHTDLRIQRRPPAGATARGPLRPPRKSPRAPPTQRPDTVRDSHERAPSGQ